MSLLQKLKLPPLSAKPAAPAPEVDPKDVRALRGEFEARERGVRSNLKKVNDAVAKIERGLSGAQGPKKDELEGQKQQLSDHVGNFERELVGIARDLKSLDEPAITADKFKKLKARQRAEVEIASDMKLNLPDDPFIRALAEVDAKDLRDLRAAFQTRERSTRAQLKQVIDAIGKLEPRIKAAQGAEKGDLDGKKMRLSVHVGNFERELQGITRDLKELEDPTLPAEKFKKLKARQEAELDVKETVEFGLQNAMK